MGWAARTREGRSGRGQRKALADRPGIIGVLSSDRHTWPQFAACLRLLDVPWGTRFTWKWGAGWDLARMRNDVCAEAVRAGAGWVWFIDDDQVFPPDILARLLHLDVDMVAPLCSFRRPPFQATPVGGKVFDVPADATDDELVKLYTDPATMRLLPPKTPGPVELAHIGTSGMLIDAEVLDVMPRPWFEMGRLPGSNASEDTWFCAKARRLGFKVWRDNGTAMGHLAAVAVWPTWGGLDGSHTFDFDGADIENLSRPKPPAV